MRLKRINPGFYVVTHTQITLAQAYENDKSYVWRVRWGDGRHTDYPTRADAAEGIEAALGQPIRRTTSTCLNYPANEGGGYDA